MVTQCNRKCYGIMRFNHLQFDIQCTLRINNIFNIKAHMVAYICDRDVFNVDFKLESMVFNTHLYTIRIVKFQIKLFL